MRSLSDSTKNVKVTSKAKEDEQNDKINNLINEVEDLDSRMDTAENNISALSETVSTNTVIANDVQANDVLTNTLSASTIEADTSIETKQLETEDLTSTGISRLNTVRATSGEITTLESQNATIENATIANADITNIDIENLSGTNMSYENATFDDVDVNNNIDVDGNVIVGGNITASGTLSVPSGSVSSLSSNEINATDIEATNIEATNGKITFLKNRHLTHDDNYVDINQVVSDTDFVIIELPKIETGDYRVTYKQLVDGYPALTMFSLTLNETADNQWFSYSRAGDQKYMDEIAIKDGKLYIKTWYTGRLYFHSDTLANVTGPKSYGEWPIDINDLDYPLFSATRAKATVYTHYVNLGMDADSYGSAVLTMNPTSDYEDCATQAETAPEIQYDPNTDTQIYLYVPNQDVNKEADVEFENAKINDTLTIPENAAIDIKDMADNQYITKRDGATTYRDIADGQIDDQPLSRLEDDLVTERKIANWNGATNRPYVPGTEPSSFTGVFSERDTSDPEDYGTKSATSLSNIYKLTAGNNITYYKEVPNAQISGELYTSSIEKTDLDDFITNTPVGYSYHLDSEVDNVKFYTLMNTSTGTVAFACDDGEYAYGTDYVGQETDATFESLGLTKSTEYDSLVSSEWDTDQWKVDIVYVATAYDYLDKYWSVASGGIGQVFPKGTGQNIDGALVSSTATATGATFYYNAAEYIATSHDYAGPTAQNCEIDTNGDVTPNSQTEYKYNYEREWHTPGNSNNDTYSTSQKYYNPNDATVAADPTAIDDSLFTQNYRSGTQIDSDISDWKGTKGAGYVLYHESTTATLSSCGLYLNDNTKVATVNITGGGAGRPRCKVIDNTYRIGLTKDGSDPVNAQDYPVTVDDVASGQALKYVYTLSNGTTYKYVHTDTRDDNNYRYKSWSWSGWSETNDASVVWPATNSYTRYKMLSDSDVSVRGYIEQANTDIKFSGTVFRQGKDTTITYERTESIPATNWAAYWTADLDKDYFQDTGANGNKYILMHNDTKVPDPLINGTVYDGSRINVAGYDKLIMFMVNPVHVTTSTLDYDSIERVIEPSQEVQYSSSITHVGKITEGEWDAGKIVAPKVTTDELTADELTVDNDLTVTGNASIGGNLNVTGTIITVHSEEITTEENTIRLRDGAQTAIQPGEMSGIIIENYDGQGNDSEIALDSNGTLRIGDTNDTEPVATRDEAANFTNGNYIAWDAANSRLVDSGIAPTDLREWAVIVGFDEYEDKTGDTSYTGIDDILTTLGTYTVSKGITSVLFEAPITSQTKFDLLNLSPSWLASGYLTGTLKILGGNVTFISKDNNIGWRYNGSTWSSLDVKTHAQIKLNYTGDWSTQTAAQKMDIGESYNADTEAVYVTGDVAGKHLVIAPTETYAKNATAQNVEVDQNNGTVGYLMKGGYSFTGVLKVPVGNPWNLIPTGTNIPAGTMWVN